MKTKKMGIGTEGSGKTGSGGARLDNKQITAMRGATSSVFLGS